MPVDRRTFLQVAVSGAALLVANPLRAGSPPPSPAPFGPFLRLHRDGIVEIMAPVIEMGQGIHSTLAAAVTEELRCDWAAVRVSAAPAADAYRGPLGTQLTFGSRSTRSWLPPLRTAAARARDLMLRSAATQWAVAPGTCTVANGAVHHAASGRTLAFAELIDTAATLPPRPPPALADPSEWRFLGQSRPRTDVPAKVNGTAGFGIDVRFPDMLHAVPRLGPTHRSRVIGYDAAAILGMPGVRAVVPIARGVAVVADSTWRAARAAAALPIRFETPPAPSSDAQSALLRDAFAGQGITFMGQDTEPYPFDTARDRSIVSAEYETPFLVHAALEPINCTARVADGACEVWAPTQAQSRAQAAAAHAAGVPRDRVTVHSTLIGGGFGRRSVVDYVLQAATVARAMAGVPVKLTWLREDDSRHDYFRPAQIGRFRAALAPDGSVDALECRLAAPAIRSSLIRDLAAFDPYRLLKGVDILAPGGINDQPYALPALRAEHIEVDLGVETGAWRSIGHSQNCFMLESFVDELAHAAGSDPLAYRHKLLAADSRGHALLDSAARAAGWRKGKRRALGISLVTYSGSIAATVAEVVKAGDRWRVSHLWCAIDCGPVIDPDTAHAQAEGGMLFGLSAALTGDARFDDQGHLEQTRFSDHRLLAMGDIPGLDILFVPQTAEIGGMGEIGVPGVAPAVAGALFAATGQRLRRLPFARSGLV